MNQNDYSFLLPDELIAQAPVSPRDNARLFVYDTQTDEIHFDTFANIGEYLPKPSLLVFNNSKVVPARLHLTKPIIPPAPLDHVIRGGGKTELFLMMNEYHVGDTKCKGVVDRTVRIGERFYTKDGKYFEVTRGEDRFYFFKPSFPISDIWQFLEDEGVTPIPPYIENSPLSETMLRNEYQSVLAKIPASVAAPTASLHFTKELLAQLASDSINQTEVTLHVGAGTFALIDETNFKTKKLFTEYYTVEHDTAEKINKAKAEGIPIIPVGTTALRSLESAIQGQALDKVVAGSNATNIFIYPPYEFKVADALITNFHIPKSSLMLLVDALLQHKKAKRDILDLYAIAIENKFRFYSFGDGMLIL